MAAQGGGVAPSSSQVAPPTAHPARTPRSQCPAPRSRAVCRSSPGLGHWEQPLGSASTAPPSAGYLAISRRFPYDRSGRVAHCLIAKVRFRPAPSNRTGHFCCIRLPSRDELDLEKRIRLGVQDRLDRTMGLTPSSVKSQDCSACDPSPCTRLSRAPWVVVTTPITTVTLPYLVGYVPSPPPVCTGDQVVSR